MTKQVAWVFGLFAVVAAACGDDTTSGVVNPGTGSGGTMGSGSSTGTGGAGAAPVAPIPETSVPAVPGATCAGPSGDQTTSRPLTPPLQLGTASLAVAPPAISGGTLRVLADGITAVAADPDRDQIYVVDLSTHTLTATIPLAPGDEPGRVAEDAAGIVHVALRGGGALVSIAPALGAITGRRAVCAAPRGIAYDAAVDLLHVACAGGELVSLRAAGGDPVRTLSLPPDLRDIVVDGPQLRVSRFRSAEVLTVDGDGRVSATLPMPSARSTATRGGQLFTPSVAWRMVGMPTGGGVAVVHQRGVADEVQTNTASGYGGKNTCDSIIHTAVSVVNGDGTTSTGPALADLPVAVDLAVSPDGRAIAVISAGNARLTGSMRTGLFVSDVGVVAGGGVNGGIGCRGSAGSVSCSGSSCSGHIPYMTGQPTAVAYAPNGDVIVQTREPAQLLTPGFTIPLSTVSRADPGHDVFHVNAGASLACASCHAEGRDDGRTWNFACDNRRRTQSLQVGLRGTEPFHWNGDEKDFSALVHDVFNNRMSGPTLSDTAIDMTLHWIDAQPRMRLARPADAAAVERGRTHFVNAACATCHLGEHFTNNQTMDVGTGGKFQVPSLIGVAARAPFLHNGCAATLRDRFKAECGGGDKHGLTSRLGANELSDLIAYLETL